MLRGSLPVIAVAAVSVASSAHAAVVSFTSKVIWDSYVTGAGASIATEDFNSFPDGFYASAGGSVGGIAWTASAASAFPGASASASPWPVPF